MRGIVLYIYEDICKEMMLLMIKAVLNNDIVRMITNIEQNKFTLNNIKLPAITRNKLRKNSKKKSSYASNKIEGNPLTEKQVSDVIDIDEHKHFLKPEQEVRNYYTIPKIEHKKSHGYISLYFLRKYHRASYATRKYKTRRTLCEGIILPLGTLSLLVAVADT